MDSWTIVIFIVWIVGWGCIGALIGSNKGRTGTGVLLGAGLGIIGVIVIALLPPTPQARTRRDREFARTLSSVLPAEQPPSHSARSSVKATATSPPRSQLMAEAIERDPSLADPGNPEALRRLNVAIDDLAEEHRTRLELEALLRSQARQRSVVSDPLSDLAKALDPASDQDTLWKLIRSADSDVALAAAGNPSTPSWVLRRMLRDSDNPTLRQAIAASLDTREDAE